MNSLDCLGGPGFFRSGRVRVGPIMVWAAPRPRLRICGPGRPIARLAKFEGAADDRGSSGWRLPANLRVLGIMYQMGKCLI